MKYAFLMILMMAGLFVPALLYAHTDPWSAAEVRVISDGGGEFPRFRTFPRLCGDGQYYYMEAVKGEKYSIEVTNKSDRRIGVVIAVDGRNIVSGQKSDLKNNERMYIIEPRATNTFEGWRTGMDRTNRFYFTGQSDSYAEKVFADASAMGTIAVAVYREKIIERAPVPPSIDYNRSRGAGGQAHRDSEKSSSCDAKEEAGTGFGSTTYSPVRIVSFEPEKTMAGKVVLKYEWRSELCRKGIIQCGPQNRFWPGDVGFAPVPRDFRE
jgi:hypothetical protein